MSNTISANVREQHKRRWTALREKGATAGFEQAKFLYSVLTGYHDGDQRSLAEYLALIGEFKGKRISRLVRLAVAFSVDGTRRHWTALGADGMALITRISSVQKRNRIFMELERIMLRTGRDVVAAGTVRLVARKVLGIRGYRKVAIEFSNRGTGGEHRERALAFQRDLLRLCQVGNNLSLISKESKALLGLSAARRVG